MTERELCAEEGPTGREQRELENTVMYKTRISGPYYRVFRENYRVFHETACALRVLVRELNGEGIKLRGRKLCSSVVHQILRKRLYTGDFD
jgi:hypothetical protein